MGKSIMVGSFNALLPTGLFASFSGPGTSTALEVNSRISATEAARFTRLASRITAGGSGVNTLTLRNSGANGANAAVRTGIGLAEDLVNADNFSAAQTFNVATTDTGTDPNYSWWRVVIEFLAGHGAFYASSDCAGVIYDLDSTTSYMAIHGRLTADGEAVEANVAWLNRAHDTWVAAQVRVIANARVNTSTVKNRIAGADGSASIAIGAGLTGLFTALGLSDAIADGDALALSITLGVGVQDLTLTIVGATLKSSANLKSESVSGNMLGQPRTAGATPHYGNIGGALSTGATTTESIRQMSLGFPARLSNLRAFVTANTYTGSMTYTLRVNGAAGLVKTITTLAVGWQENSTDTIVVDGDDQLCLEYDEGTSGTMTITLAGLTIEDLTPQVMAARQRGQIDPIQVKGQIVSDGFVPANAQRVN